MALKDKALELLGSGETVSGAQLARELGVSRNAVWKVMNQLRQSGYDIDAVTNRGYRLLSAPALLSETEIRRWLTTRELAFGKFDICKQNAKQKIKYQSHQNGYLPS